MRSLRYSVTVLVLVGSMPLLAMAQAAPKDLPVSERPARAYGRCLPGVEYDTPADQAAIDACKVESVVNAQKHNVGYALRDGQGKAAAPVRRQPTAADRLDQWSYYQDGFEVYREDDLDGDRSLDECRWLNAGGTRIARGDEGEDQGLEADLGRRGVQGPGCRLSPRGDVALLETVMATPDELTAAGVPKDVVDKVAAAAGKRAEQVAALQKTLVGWNNQTVWNRFDGTFPHVIPADPSQRPGEGPDALRERHGDSGNLGRSTECGQARVPPDPRHDPAGRDLEIHRAAACDRSREADRGGGQRHPLDALRRANNVEPRDEAMDAALKALADYDVKNAAAAAGRRARKRSPGTTSAEFRCCAASSRRRRAPKTN